MKSSHLTEHENEISECGQVSCFRVLNDDYKWLAAACLQGSSCRTACKLSLRQQFTESLLERGYRHRHMSACGSTPHALT